MVPPQAPSHRRAPTKSAPLASAAVEEGRQPEGADHVEGHGQERVARVLLAHPPAVGQVDPLGDGRAAVAQEAGERVVLGGGEQHVPLAERHDRGLVGVVVRLEHRRGLREHEGAQGGEAGGGHGDLGPPHAAGRAGGGGWARDGVGWPPVRACEEHGSGHAGTVTGRAPGSLGSRCGLPVRSRRPTRRVRRGRPRRDPRPRRPPGGAGRRLRRPRDRLAGALRWPGGWRRGSVPPVCPRATRRAMTSLPIGTMSRPERSWRAPGTASTSIRRQARTVSTRQSSLLTLGTSARDVSHSSRATLSGSSKRILRIADVSR